MPERSQWSWTGLNNWVLGCGAGRNLDDMVHRGIRDMDRPASGLSGIGAYAASFDAVGYLAWVIPCFLLSMTFPVLMVAIYLYLPADRRAPALVALLFACLYGAILGATYFLLGTVVRTALLAGNLDGLELLVIGSPYSILNALEGAGYLFMGLATLFAGMAWRVPGRWRRATRWILISNGAVGILA